jgi:hypothetical protein
MAERERSLIVARGLLWAVAFGTAVYWLAYLAGLRLSGGPECAGQLQLAQIPSNFWIVAAAALGAIGLRRKRRWGLFMVVAAASAGLYIGLFDITFNIRNGVYAGPWGQLAPELFANSVCTILPAYLFYVTFRAPAWE